MSYEGNPLDRPIDRYLDERVKQRARQPWEAGIIVGASDVDEFLEQTYKAQMAEMRRKGYLDRIRG